MNPYRKQQDFSTTSGWAAQVVGSAGHQTEPASMLGGSRVQSRGMSARDVKRENRRLASLGLPLIDEDEERRKRGVDSRHRSRANPRDAKRARDLDRRRAKSAQMHRHSD